MKVFPGLIYLRIKIKTSQNVLVLICHFSLLFVSFLGEFLAVHGPKKEAAKAAAALLNLNCKWISSGFIDFSQRTSFPGQHSYYPFVPIGRRQFRDLQQGHRENAIFWKIKKNV